MSARATLLLFSILFALGILLIVVLPFLLAERPASRPDDARPPPRTSGDGSADQGVFRSDDGGKTWRSASWIEGQTISIAGVSVNRLVADLADPETLYLATAGSGLWVSRSGGELWARVADGAGVLQANAQVLAMAVNPARREEWYVAVFQDGRGRVLRSVDDGATFREVYATALERFGVFDVYYDSGRDEISIATGQGGYLASANGGKTWRVVRWFADGLIRLLVNPANPWVRFVVTSKGAIFRTTDAGASWADITPALGAFSGATQNQRWHLDHSGTLWLGSRYGLLRSRSNGATFTAPPLIVPPDALPVLAIAVDPSDAGHIIVSAGSQLYRSRDDGESWAILPPPSQKRITHLLIDGQNSETIYAVAQP